MPSKSRNRKGNDLAELKLSDFIRTHMETILAEWEQFAKAIPSAREMSQEELRDHAIGMLDDIADDLDRSQTRQAQLVKSQGRVLSGDKETEAGRHGGRRMLSGFSVSDTMSEFRALRACVTRLWIDSQPAPIQPAGEGLIRFNEAIDQAFTESLKRYTLDKNRQTRLFDTILSTSPDIIVVFDAAGTIIYANRSLTALYHLSLEQIAGKNLSELDPVAAAKIQQQLLHILDIKRDSREDVMHTLPDGEKRIYDYSFFPVINDEGNVEAIAGTAQNMTERRLKEEKLLQIANYDSLTGLPNRGLFFDQLNREIKRSSRTGFPIALFFLDLDKFKEVNDQLGHDAGDELLRQAAQRIRSCVRDTDTVARLGGDEFTVILAEVQRNAHVERVARKILDELARPFSILGKDVHVSGSLGVTLHPQDATTSEDLIRNADQAMYVSKDEGGNRYHYFTQSMQQAAQNRWQLIEDLRGALKKNQICVYYQPIVDIGTGRIVMAEALVRWKHPVRGIIGPDEFIPLAEETGLMVGIGDWVFREAARKAKRIRERYAPVFHISVNQSITQFRKDSTQFGTWLDYLGELGLAGDSIVIEIRERTMMDANSVIGEKLSAFRRAGIQVSLDDFGTGLSSVSYLKKFDINYVKIDQPFVVNLTADPDAMAICEAIVVMAHKLGLKVIAEGVETTEQKALLQNAGCDYAQGYLFSTPVPSREFDKLLDKDRKRHRQPPDAAYIAHERPSQGHMAPPAMPKSAAPARRKNRADIKGHDS